MDIEAPSTKRVAAIEQSLYGMDAIRGLLGEPTLRDALVSAQSSDDVATLEVTGQAPRDVAEHLLRRAIQEAQLIPEHGPRKASAAYRRTHAKLINTQDRGCIVCGVSRKTLSDPDKNPFDASQMETHHRLIEWSLTNAVDLAKFNERVLPGLRRRSPTRPDYQAPFNQAQLVQWIDADEDNMWVLCDVHHRHELVGVHMVTGPIWAPQDLLLSKYQSGRQGTDAQGGPT